MNSKLTLRLSDEQEIYLRVFETFNFSNEISQKLAKLTIFYEILGNHIKFTLKKFCFYCLISLHLQIANLHNL